MLCLVTGAWLMFKCVKRKKTELKKNSSRKMVGNCCNKSFLPPKVILTKQNFFTSKELEKMTNNFNMNRILGQRGPGTIY